MLSFLRADAVLRREQPAAAPLLDRVQTVAGHALHDLRVEGGVIAIQEARELAAGLKLGREAGGVIRRALPATCTICR